MSFFDFPIFNVVKEMCLIQSIFSFHFQTEIAKRLNALISQLLPCLQGEHQQQVLQAVERAKQVTVPELNAIIGVSVVSRN